MAASPKDGELELHFNESMDDGDSGRNTRSSIREDQQAADERRLEGIVGRILTRDLSSQIGRIVRQETALALAEVRGGAEASGGSERWVQTPVLSESGGLEGKVPRLERRLGGEIIDTFDPDTIEANVGRWLTRIDQLGEVHEWTPYEHVAIMQERLRGQARSWFNRLGNYDFTWTGWKEKLLAAFPRRRDYVAAVREYLDRRKHWSENLTYKSDLFPQTSGVPQGSILGPLFFILFINDIYCDINSDSYYMQTI